MGIYNSKLWISDLNEIVDNITELDELAGKRIMITGCTGLICSTVIDVLIRWNETHDNKIHILAAGRDERKSSLRFDLYSNREWFTFVPYNAACVENNLLFPCDYIIHGASNASPNKIAKEPVETMMSNFVGMKWLLDYAKAQGTKSVLYISSSEVYGRNHHEKPIRINEYGGIDLLSSRNSYSVGKCATETLCASYYEEYGVEFVIVRPGHIYGPTAAESDNRVSSAWAFAAARGEDIVMKSDGLQIRSYCYCLDCASAILKVLINGKKNCAYNISNPNSIISIKEMAEILARAGNTKLILHKPNEIERKNFNPMSNSSLDSSELESLGWKGLFDAERGFFHTVRIINEIY